MSRSLVKSPLAPGKVVDVVVGDVVSKTSPGITKKELSKLTDAEKRVLVAQDVLDQLGLTLMAQRSTYVESHEFESASAREIIDNTCNVCAVGAAFVAYARRFRPRGVTLGAIEALESNQPGPLGKLFPKPMLHEMEELFEFWHPYEETLSDYTPTERLRLIMQNIVDNEGELLPEQLGEVDG